MRQIDPREHFAANWDGSFWFADHPDDEDDISPELWVPNIQVPGCILTLQIGFETKAACEDWIRRYLAQPDIDAS